VKNFTESTLIALLKQQNIHAFNELYSRYCKELYSRAYKRLGSKYDAQDILQDIFLSVWNNAGLIDEDKSLGPYLYQSLKFKIIDRYYKKVKFSCDEIDSPKMEFTSGDGANDKVLLKELEDLLNNEIGRLPVKMREVFLLSRGEHLSNQKISERLSISSQTVKNQISLALKKLKCAVDDYNTI
jgi:RNA polymerase sigma-70 factor (family 1)